MLRLIVKLSINVPIVIRYVSQPHPHFQTAAMQIPDRIASVDASNLVSLGYWPSFNVPYFEVSWRPLVVVSSSSRQTIASQSTLEHTCWYPLSFVCKAMRYEPLT